MASDSDPEPASASAPTKPSKSALTKFVLPVVLPVVIAILVTAFTPVGERLRNALFPSSSTVRGTVKVQNKPLAGADVSSGGKRVTTDGSGVFVLGKVNQGDHVLVIQGIGVRTREVAFEVKRGSDATVLDGLEVQPSLRLAGEGSGGFDPVPSSASFGTFSISYDLTFWLEGDPDMLGRVSKVTYRFSDRIRPKPIDVTTAGNRYCHRLKGTVQVKIGETVDGAVAVAVSLKDGKTLELSVAGDEKPPPGQRPAGCPPAR